MIMISRPSQTMNISMPEIILGPPGTGKTTALLKCVDKELVTGTPPNRIGFLSFTRRAAEEAISRACTKFKFERDKFPYFRTLHSLCYHALRLSRSDVMTDAKMQEFADYIGIKITGRWSEDGSFYGQSIGDRALYIDNMARVRCIPLRKQYDQDDYGIPWSLMEKISKGLIAFKSAHGLLDYTDFLEEFIRGHKREIPKLDVLIVDEAQDLSTLQWMVVHMIANDCRRFIIAGDDDQAIFQWAGANVHHLLELKGDVRVLRQSWRVPRSIQTVATQLSEQIKKRYDKEWSPRDAEGTIHRAYNVDDIDFGGDDVLVLVRNEYLMRPIASALRREGIVYEMHGHPSIKARYLEAAESWTRLQRDKAISLDDARRMYSLMSVDKGVKRGFKTLPGYADDDQIYYDNLVKNGGLLLPQNIIWKDALDKIPDNEMAYMSAALRRGIKLRQKPAVRVSTIHTAKGAEADHVVLLTEIAKRSYQEVQTNPDDELRVWYVGVTRAREKLTLVDSSSQLRCQWL